MSRNERSLFNRDYDSVVFFCCVTLWLLLTLCAETRGGSPNWMYLGVIGVGPPMQRHPAIGSDLEEQDPELAIAKAVCSAIPGLVAQQVDVCMSHPATIRSVSDGARKGIQECQYQFRNERWNCSTDSNDQSVFGYILERGSKETAFIYAVTSAGVVHTVTQACSSGNLTECSCDVAKQGHATPEGWKWGGCSDNLQYGIQFARKFVDAPEKIKPFGLSAKGKKSWGVRTRMNVHNNEVGRQVVSSLMRMQCRCHGVSGSCELKTCWKTMPSFNEVGDILKRKYRQAVQVTRGSVLGTDHSKGKKKQRSKRKVKRRLPAAKSDLVHIHKSPNYCVHDPGKGILGTQGRICNKTSNGPDSCDLLCCGRGYNTQVMKYIERCHCKFVWCCYVKCKTCETQIDLHTCK